MKKIFTVLALIAFKIIAAQNPGTLDVTFNSTGYVYSSAGVEESMHDLALQPDGKIVTVGFAKIESYGVSDMVVARYTSNGLPDGGFGTNGMVMMNLFQNGMSGEAIALQGNGKIIAGYTGSHSSLDRWAGLVRFDQYGTVDSTFGTNGLVNIHLDYFKGKLDMTVMSNDQIILLSPGLLSKFNPDGTPDITFGDQGALLVPTLPGFEFTTLMSVEVQPDGKILLAGENDGTHTLLLARFNPDGSPDIDFGNQGITSFNHGIGHDIALQADGKVVVGGDNSAAPSALLIVRFNPTGTLDETFGSGGFVEKFMEGSFEYMNCRSVLLEPSGKLIVAGMKEDRRYLNGGWGGYKVMKRETYTYRYKSDGSLDKTYKGAVLTGGIEELSLQPDGKIVCAGHAGLQMNDQMMMRLHGGSGGKASEAEEVDYIKNETEGEQLFVYPNPARDKVNIGNLCGDKIQLINLSGQILYESDILYNETSIEVGNYKSGLYLIRVYNKENSETLKIFVE